MLEIIICDDKRSAVDRLESFIEAYLIEEEKQDIYTGLATVTPDTVLEHLGLNGNPPTSTSKCRLFLLDIEYEDKASYDGIDLATTIRKHDPFSDIVFVTSNRNLASDALRHRILPLDYLNKGFDMEELRDQIISVIKISYERMIARTAKDEKVKINCGRKSIYVDLSQILYIKGNHAYHDDDVAPEIEFPYSSTAFLRTEARDFDLRKPLKFYEQDVDQLVRLGRSYLLNPLCVCETRLSGKKGYVTLTSGEEISVMRESVIKYQATVKAMREQRSIG